MGTISCANRGTIREGGVSRLEQRFTRSDGPRKAYFGLRTPAKHGSDAFALCYPWPIMHRVFALFCVAAALSCASLSSAAQTFEPKSIEFAGAPENSTQELLGATALKPGTVLSYADMNDRSQKLVNTGLFSAVSFKFDGERLTFQLTPASALLPVRFENMPFPIGKDLEDNLHRQFPLYHSRVPELGGITESVRGALVQMLAAQGIQAVVAAVPVRDTVSHQSVAVGFSVTAPPVLVGELRTEGAIVALDPKASAVVAQLRGVPYNAEESPRRMEAALRAYYIGQGYPEPTIHAVAAAKPSVGVDAIRIPFRISILPGAQYKLAAIDLAPGLLVTQAEFDRQSPIYTGDFADERLKEDWKFIERQYHNHGYVKAKIQPAATFDNAGKTVRYAVDVDPGPTYTMGSLTLEGVTDELRSAMLAVWKMPAGSVFDEGAIAGFFGTHGANPALESVFSQVNYKYTLHPNDDSRTVDLTLSLEKKP
jgi:outer membrane protein assembly factor BamA